MSCIEIKTKKYQSRNSPPYHANECKGEIKVGNDGKNWKSISNKNMIYKWIPISKTSKNITKSNTKINANTNINTKTNTKSKLIDIPKGKIYFIHDNGGRPFKVIINKNDKIAYVYRDTRDWKMKDVPDEPIYDKLVLKTKYKKVFDGSPISNDFIKGGYTFEIGNSMLLQISKTLYIHIGIEIYSFIISNSKDEEIIQYVSPIGNNDVPYPFAVSKNKTYLMIEDVILDNQELNKVGETCTPEKYKTDPYFLYYGFCEQDNMLKKSAHKLKKKILQARL